ncbi:hypothetical protein [Streptomyces sp. CFMR 7]|uniref:hypothetical protein n=1 Tax=Streptomyces sp. CFMR 7 TaxID=1649184 RepID=UPI0011A86551|nr:hypothetical protein [Streptomyces sp. CFMR 7]
MDYFEDQLDSWLQSSRRLLPISRFNDKDIRSFDYPTWKGTEQAHMWFGEPERMLQELKNRIEIEGLRKPVEIWAASTEGHSPVVYDGHHRITVFRQLGWTHIPYRWFTSHPITRKHTYHRKPIP